MTPVNEDVRISDGEIDEAALARCMKSSISNIHRGDSLERLTRPSQTIAICGRGPSSCSRLEC